jgi:hypothetical protein
VTDVNALMLGNVRLPVYLSFLNRMLMLKNTLRLGLLSVLLILTVPSEAAVVTPDQAGALTYSLEDLQRDKVEARLGRKLKFKEKVGLWILKKRVKRQERRAKRAQRGTGPVDGLAIASFICGILGFLGITAIAAVVLGIISLSGFSRDPGFRTGRGFAIAGIVLGGLTILGFLLLVTFFALIF